MKREYPDRPIVAVGAIILDGQRVALIQRAKEPGAGKWTFPGGAVELGETVREAARREALEETGLDVEIGEVAVVVDRLFRDDAGQIVYHYVIVDFLARPAGGALVPGEDARDARWVGRDELEAVDMTAGAREVALKALQDAS